MADVADEVALAGESELEPVEHSVEGLAEVGELVVAFDIDAPLQVGARYRARGVAKLAQRHQHPACCVEGERRSQQQGPEGDERHHLHGFVDAFAFAGREMGDNEGAQGFALGPERDRRVFGIAAGSDKFATLGLLEVAPPLQLGFAKAVIGDLGRPVAGLAFDRHDKQLLADTGHIAIDRIFIVVVLFN